MSHRKNPAAGHRQRLRERFLQAGLSAFLDYEVLELLLTFGTPRKDCKTQAKNLIKKFGSLKAVLDAEDKDLQKIKGIGPKNIFAIKFFRQLKKRYEEETIKSRKNLDSVKKVVKLLQEKIGNKKKEYFLVLNLDSRKNLIEISTISKGSTDFSIAHPRDVLKEAVDNLASGIIITHNHPTGNPEPSEEDILLTHRIKKSAVILGIELIDHIIITPDSYFSFAEAGIL